MLDTQDPVTGSAPGTEKQLNLTGPTFFGSWPSTTATGGHHPGPPPLDGCLKDLELDGQAVSLVSEREPLLQLAGQVGECDQHACTGQPCRHGAQCRGGGGGMGRLQCICSAGYYGERCGGRRSLCRPNPCEGGGRCISGKEQVRFVPFLPSLCYIYFQLSSLHS